MSGQNQNLYKARPRRESDQFQEFFKMQLNLLLCFSLTTMSEKPFGQIKPTFGHPNQDLEYKLLLPVYLPFVRVGERSNVQIQLSQPHCCAGAIGQFLRKLELPNPISRRL